MFKNILIILFYLLFSFSKANSQLYKGFIRASALITAQDLKQLIDNKDPKLVIFVISQNIQYRLGHIPGSYQLWRGDYKAKEGKYDFGGMVADAPSFQLLMRKYGVDNDSKVVIYDYKYDATRLWWIFHIYGKKDIRILDGGYKAWRKAEYPIEFFEKDMPLTQGNFITKKRKGFMLATMEQVKKTKDERLYQLWDTRERDEWNGSNLKRGAFRKGRIPWAKFLNWAVFKDKKTQEFLEAKEMEKIVFSNKIRREKKQIFYCQSGVRTTQVMFALYLLGWPEDNLLNYDGSWIEWSYHQKNPLIQEF